MSPRTAALLLPLVVFAAVGCGAGAPESAMKPAAASRTGGAASPAGEMAAEAPPFGGDGEPQQFVRRGEARPEPPAAKAGEDKPAPEVLPAERRIIYTATLDVVVKDLDAATAEVQRLLAAHKGYVAKSEARGNVGSQRAATFTLRVPAAHFRPLADALAGLGYAERNAVDSQDVTEEFVDVEARLRNLRQEEDALNRLLEKAASTKDVLDIRQQVQPVRERIDRAEARLKYLSTMTALSTVNLSLREIKDYVPPTAPTFADRAGRTFDASWESLGQFGTAVALFAVGLVPWLPVIGLVVLAAWLIRRRVRAV